MNQIPVNIFYNGKHSANVNDIKNIEQVKGFLDWFQDDSKNMQISVKMDIRGKAKKK
ncbi:MAG: hypothetical protein IT569_00580 [Leptospiraceae bacterium]|nr:hypothetical protein [Leptospiraceae bacterium]